MPFPYSFSAGPPPPSLMPQASEAQRDLQRLIALKPPTDPATGLSARQNTKQAAEYREALQDILDRYGSMDNFQDALQGSAGAPGLQLASAASSDAPDFMAGPLADPSLGQFAQDVAAPTDFGGNRFGGQKFGGQQFGGQKFGGGRFGASAAPALPPAGTLPESLVPPPGLPPGGIEPGRAGAGGYTGAGEDILSRLQEMFAGAGGPPGLPPRVAGGRAPPDPLAAMNPMAAGMGAMAAGLNPIPSPPPAGAPIVSPPPMPGRGPPAPVPDDLGSPFSTPLATTGGAGYDPRTDITWNAARRGGIPPTAPPPKPTNGFDPQNLLEFGLRMMSASEAQPGSTRGPGLFGALGQAGAGTLAGARTRKKEKATAETAERRHQEKMTLERRKVDISAARNANDAETKRLLIKIDQDNKKLDRRLDEMNLNVRVMNQIGETRKDYADRRESLVMEAAMQGLSEDEQKAQLQALRAEEQAMVNRLMGLAGGGAATAQEPTATDPKTGKKVVLRNGQWVPK